MTADGMVRRAPAPPAIEAGKGRQRRGARQPQNPNSAVFVVGMISATASSAR